jgi:flagellar motor switch protein FliN/FliY
MAGDVAIHSNEHYVDAPWPGAPPAHIRTGGISGRATGGTSPLDSPRDAQLDVKIELGRATMDAAGEVQLRPGAVVLLDKLADDSLDVVVNGRLVARGEIVVLENTYCIRIVEIVAASDAA